MSKQGLAACTLTEPLLPVQYWLVMALRRECLEVHATAAMIADVGSIEQMLMSIIPELQKGRSVEQMQQPWPEAVKDASGTGLWWDVANR